MAKASTAKFEKSLFEVEFSPGVWSRPCGLTSRGINRENNMTETRVPFCGSEAEEAKPMAVELTPDSTVVTISGAGGWAQEHHEEFMQWFYGGTLKNVRWRHANAAVGDTEYETGPAYLTTLNNESTKENGTVTADISIRFDGTPTLTPKA